MKPATSLHVRTLVASALVAAVIAPAAGGAPLHRPAAPRRQTVIVRFDAGVSDAARRALARRAGATITGNIGALDLQRVEVASEAVSLYETSPMVSWVGPDRRFTILDKPNDPLLAYQWAHDKLRTFSAWRIETGTRSPVTVAVADTGIDLSHPDFEGRLVPGFDFVNRDDDPADDHGHGTHVSGIIAANPDNRIGIAGLSWGAKIMPLKVCGARGGCDEFAVTAGIVHAVLAGARVVNLSLGGAAPACPRAWALAARLAEARGTLLVAAAGNSAAQGNPIGYPAACPGYLGVAATDPNDGWATFSQYGDYIDVSAPGVSIMSTVPPDSGLSDRKTPGYGDASGTSMASPHGAGLAALLFSLHPDWLPAQVQQRMEQTAVDLGPKGRDKFFGAGRIDVRAAVSGK